MTSREPSLPELLDAAITARLRGVHTALPGTIRSYSEADQTATVELAVQLECTAETFAKVPNLSDVPVVWPGAWANGDKCLVIFSEEDASKWWETGSVEPPSVMQRHGLHALCIPLAAEAGDAVQFVALKGLVEQALLDLLDGIISAAASITAPGGGPAFVGALNTFKTAYQLALQVGATKVKAR